MSKFVVTILILIGFLNSIAIASDDLSVASKNRTIESASCPIHTSDSSANENNSHSHQCHVGHCAFVVTETSSFDGTSFEDSRKVIEDSIYLGSFQSELFRPPIV